MANYDIFIFEGHGEGDCGAVGNGRQEHTEAKRFNDKVCEYLKPTGLSIHRSNGKNNFKNCQLVGNTYRYKFGFTTHLNASASSAATGSEILVQSQEKYIELEQSILKRICSLTGLANRGLKSKDYNTDNTVQRKPGSTANFSKDWYKELRDARNQGICLSILELCFITNINDMKLFDKYFNDIAFIVADEIAKYCDKSISKPSSSPTSSNTSSDVKPPTEASDALYRVFVDGNKVGSYGKIENILNQVKVAVDKKAKNIRIEKV